MTSDPGFRIGDPMVMLVCVENRPSRLVDYSATLYCTLGVVPPLAWRWLGCCTRQGKSSVILGTADAADALSFFFGLYSPTAPSHCGLARTLSPPFDSFITLLYKDTLHPTALL